MKNEVTIMKITGLEIIPASKYLFIRINTDEGIHGTGEAGAWGDVYKRQVVIVGKEVLHPVGIFETAGMVKEMCIRDRRQDERCCVGIL